MSRTLTASDRSALIRLASTLPSGSEERKAILAGLGKKAEVVGSRYFHKGTLDLRSLGRTNLVQHAVDIVNGTRPFEIDDHNAPTVNGKYQKTTVYPDATRPEVSSGYGVYTVYFTESEVGEDGDSFPLTVSFVFGNREIEWYMDSDH